MYRAFAASLLLACAAHALPAGAAIQTWTGAGATSNWSDTGNWQGGSVPGAADRAAFTGTGSPPVVNVDGPISLDGIDFSGDAPYTFSGSAVTLTGPTPVTLTSSTNGVFTFTTNMTFAAAGASITISAPTFPGPQLKFLQGTVAFSGGTVNVQAGTAPFGLVIFSNVHEAAATAIVVTGNAAFFQGDNNVLTGPLTSNARSLAGGGSLPFGAASIVMQQGTLGILSSSSGTKIGALTLNAANAIPSSLVASGPLSIQGAVDIAGQQTIDAQADVVVKGRLNGNGTLEILGSGSVELQSAGGGFVGTLVVDPPATLLFSADAAINRNAHLDSTGGSIILGSTKQAVSEFSCAGPFNVALPAGYLNVAGPISNRGCLLSLTIPSSLVALPGAMYTLISNGSLAPLSPFTGLPDASVVNVNGTLATVSYHGGFSGVDLVLVVSTSTAPPSFTDQLQDMWWGGSQENGWGMSLIQHDNTLFAALYIYDERGRPIWLVMPGGAWDGTHTIYTGSLYQPTGSAFYVYDASQFAAGKPAGTITITFQDANDATLDYTIDGVAGHKVIQREIFGGGAPVGVDHSDLWWGGATQNGWGIAILQQGAALFTVWYTYDDLGGTTWYVMPTGTWNPANDTYSGNLYRTMGSPWIGVPYDSSVLQVTDAGTCSITFTSGSTATFTYFSEGHNGSMELVREPF